MSLFVNHWVQVKHVLFVRFCKDAISIGLGLRLGLSLSDHTSPDIHLSLLLGEVVKGKSGFIRTITSMRLTASGSVSLIRVSSVSHMVAAPPPGPCSRPGFRVGSWWPSSLWWTWSSWYLCLHMNLSKMNWSGSVVSGTKWGSSTQMSPGLNPGKDFLKMSNQEKISRDT